jgi:20S proteasome alpha/beta subunit
MGARFPAPNRIYYPIRHLRKREILTCIIGAQGADGATIIADTRVMREYEAVNESKFHVLWDKVAIAGAGITAMMDNFAEELGGSGLPSPPTSRAVVKKVEDIAKDLYDRYSPRLDLNGGPLFDALVMGLHDFDRGDPYLRLVHSQGVGEDVKRFAIIGHGAPYVAELFGLLYDPMLTAEELAVLGHFCIASIVFLGLDQTVGMNQLGPECVILRANGRPEFLNTLGPEFTSCHQALNNLSFRLRLVSSIWKDIPQAYEAYILSTDMNDAKVAKLKAEDDARRQESEEMEKKIAKKEPKESS